MPHLKFLVAGGLIIGAISYLMFSGINDTMVYYYKVPEVLAQSPELTGKGIRISGHVLEGSIKKEPGKERVTFSVEDKDTGENMPVVYEGIIPDTFKDHAEVVVEGKLGAADGIFRANVLLAKCPSKYERMETEGESPDASDASSAYPKSTSY